MSDLHAIAIIPARGGSKGVPRKNLRLVGGKPLIAHTILQAKAAQGIERVYVSTDDAEIAQVARDFGALVIDRPAELAGDTTGSEPVLSHALPLARRDGPVDLVVFLQCTSPVRGKTDLDQALAKLSAEKADSLLSVSASHRFLWRQSPDGPVAINYDPAHRPRRQDLEAQYWENGSFYIFCPWVLEQLGNRLGGRITVFEMAETAAYDIDDETDIAVVDFLMSRTA